MFQGLKDIKKGWRSCQCQRATWDRQAANEMFVTVRERACELEKNAG